MIYIPASKDIVVYVTTKESGEAESSYAAAKPTLNPNTGDAVGPNGKIDWDCPCLQGMWDDTGVEGESEREGVLQRR